MHTLGIIDDALWNDEPHSFLYFLDRETMNLGRNDKTEAFRFRFLISEEFKQSLGLCLS